MTGVGASNPGGRQSASQVGAVLRQARERMDWPQSRLRHELQRVAAAQGLTVPNAVSLKAMISRWENGRRVPDRFNRRLLCDALGIDPHALALAMSQQPVPAGDKRPARSLRLRTLQQSPHRLVVHRSVRRRPPPGQPR